MIELNSAKSRNVLIGVTGGIAAYKACELVRLFKKSGWQVRVIMTREAENFVGALTFQSLSGEPVLRSLHDQKYDLSATSHIDLANWANLFVIAPVTANVMAKLAHGIADDALTTEALAFQGPMLLAPGMNTRMWNAVSTLENWKTLQARGVFFVGPLEGDLACGETGIGKMSEPHDIFSEAAALVSQQKLLAGKKVLITSGPTRSYIDEIRYLTNRSSGKMGHALAMEAVRLGAEVTFVTGPVDENQRLVPGAKVVAVETGKEMVEACHSEALRCDFVIGTAAVSDFGLEKPFSGKIRREGNLQLDLVSTVDVLGELGKKKKAGQIFVGFAAEFGAGEQEHLKAKEKMGKKNLDFVALNNVARKDIGFDVSENEIHLVTKKGETKVFAKQSKNEIAKCLWQEFLGV